MDESLWHEKSSYKVMSSLALWIIEHAWTNRMMDVLQVLGPPLWLEGDRSSLTLKDPCSIRVTAAESWMVIRSRDIRHFAQVMEFLDVTHTLLPQLVTPIKHMKIMFGLKTLVIMWMFWDDQSIESISDMVVKLFPNSLPQYHRSSHRHMGMMQKAQRDFRNFAQLLTRNPEMRKKYTRNQMEEQYGESYIMKLEERLLHYLEELNKALPQPTHIDQVLKQSGPLNGREELLQQLFTCNSVSPATTLTKLLKCVIASHTDHKSTEKYKQLKSGQLDGTMFGPLSVALRTSLEEAEEDWLSQATSQSSWMNRDKSLEKPVTSLKKKDILCQTETRPYVLKAEDNLKDYLCSRHGKRMKSILRECSEELRIPDEESSLVQVECTPLSPLHQSTPPCVTSASPLHDSSSTNISLSSEPGSFSYLSVDEARQRIDPSQPMTFLQTSPVRQNNSCQFSDTNSNIALRPQVSPCLECSGQPSLSQTSSSSTNISPFSANRITQESPTTDKQSSPLWSSEKKCPESSYSQPASSLSSSSSSEAPVVAPCQNSAQVSLDSHVFSESSRALAGNLRLSLETQAILLVCKWLQPQVKLYRLSQDECRQSTHSPELSSEEEEDDEDVLDVNVLYSDSEYSDPQDSDDSDYVLPKRRRKR